VTALPVATALAGAVGLRVPVDVGRAEAAAAARAELGKAIFRRDGEAWPARVVDWVVAHVQQLLQRAVQAAPGGIVGILVAVALVVLVVLLVRARLGPLRRAAAQPGAVFTGRTRSSADHRAAADRAAAAGRWDEALRERFRAVVRALEERDVVEERPGRTADEAAAAAARVLPSVAASLVAGARSFDDVVYGGRPATETDDVAMRDLDRAVTAARPSFVTADAAQSGWAAVR
jgi:hypothetical protein